MISDNLNWYNHVGYKEMIDPSSNINATDEDKSKQIIVHENLSENCSTNVSKSERNIVNETSLQKNSANLSEYTMTEIDGKEHKEPSVTKEETSYLTYSSVEGIF